MAEFIWENNGRGKFDFDYLLKLTNQDFCDAVAFYVNDSWQEKNDSIKTIKVKNVSSHILVLIVKGHGLQIYTYYKYSEMQTESFVGSVDMSWALEVINNG